MHLLVKWAAAAGRSLGAAVPEWSALGARRRQIVAELELELLLRVAPSSLLALTNQLAA